MTIKIDRIDGQYVARCSFNERFVLKKAGFEFIEKRWVTSDDDVAQSLYKFTIDNARQRLDNINEIKKKLVEASFADDYDGDLLCPKGLAYLPFQKAGIDFALKRKDVLIGDQPGLGKDQNLNAKILTPTGWKRMGDMFVGQEIIGRDGNIYHVTGVFPQGVKDAYKISFRDGTSTICGLGHLWAVKDNNTLKRKQDWKIKDLKELLKWGIHKADGKNKWQIPIADPPKFKEKKHFIDPYTLGVLLGDGYLSGSAVAFSCPDIDKEIAERVETTIKYDFRLRKDASAACPQYNIARPYTNTYSEYIREIKRLGLNLGSFDKFIPRSYLLGSVEQRIALLQGLMDTDGSCIKNRTTFHSISPTLIRDVAELVRSLGGIAIVNSYDRTKEGKGIEYRVNVKTFFNPFYVPRKANVWKPSNKNNEAKKYISNVEKLPEQLEMQCISVSAPDKLYITDDYIVTHNTIQAIGVINNDEKIKKSLLVVPASLKINWKRECEKWLCDKSLKIEIPYSKAEIYIDDEGAKRSKTVHHWPNEADVIIVNYDQLETYHDEVRKITWDLLVCDEAHVLKNAKSQKCKQVFGYIGKKKSEKLTAIKANKRVFLTGTPILNKPIDLFVLASECAPDTFGSYIKYVTRYCDAYKTTWGLDVSGASNLEEFQEKLRSTFMIRRMKADVLKELPEKRRAVVILPQDGLSKIVKKERQSFFDNMKALSIINGDSVEKDYEDISTELLNELMASVGDNITNFDNLDLEEYMKTHFEAIAYAREEIGLAKVKMVVEYAKNLLDSTDKVVIFAVHKKVVSEIRKYFNNAAVVVGGMSSDAKQAEVDRFRNDPDCNVIILNLDAGAVGWTLVEANNLIMAELGFVPPILEQAEDRIYRIGQKNAVNIWYLIVDGSIEASLIEIFIKKLEIIDKALNRQIVTEEK